MIAPRSEVGRPRWSHAGSFIAVALWSTTLVLAPAPRAVATPPLSSNVITIKVMTFNIGGDEWGGWTHKPGSPYTAPYMTDVENAIRTSGADVVGIQEPFGRMRELAAALGWYASPRLYILSRFPIIEPPGSNGIWGYIEPSPGRVFAFVDSHLPSYPYGPTEIIKGKTRKQVLAGEAGRLHWVHRILRAIQPLLDRHIPMFFTGDFNSPSWRDWTKPVIAARPWHPYPVRWPVSLLMESEGFRDSYRQIHPDAITVPGYTWPASYLGNKAKRIRRFDRIDFIWNSGPIKTIRAHVEGEPGSPYTNIPFHPWPSDHRAMVDTFHVQTVGMPPFVSVSDGYVTRGSTLTVRYKRNESGDEVSIVPAGRPVGSAILTKSAPRRFGVVRFATTSLAPGSYQVVLVSPLGGDLGRVPFWVVPPGSKPSVTLSDSTLKRSQPLRVHWKNGPGNKFDWIGVVPAGHGSPRTAPLYNWTYIGAQVDGSVKISKGDHGHWPHPPGRYQAWLCVDDGYYCNAYANFTVR
jgi:hypothetical protein